MNVFVFDEKSEYPRDKDDNDYAFWYCMIRKDMSLSINIGL